MRSVRTNAGVASLLAGLLAIGTARANGRFPTAQHVVVGPGASSNVVALRVTFGLLLSLDGGRTFHWMCEEGLYFPFVPRINFDPPVEVSSRGAVVFGYEIGLRYTHDACKAEDVRAARMRSFSDLTADPTGRILYAIEDTEGMPSAVYRGDGQTLEFTRLGRGVDNVRFDTIEVAPSNAMRLYLTGRAVDDSRPLFYRSDDGGMTLAPVAMDPGAADSLWVSGVDPTNPDTLYVRAPRGLGTELRRSRDGGRTFQTVAQTPDPMLGFAMSDDGRTLWVGSIEGGLRRSDDGGDSFRPVSPLPILCLRQHAGTLWACSDWATQHFALGRSRDRGASFEPVVNITDYTRFLGPPTCGSRSEGAEICVERWPLLQRDFADPDLFFDGGVRPARDAGLRDAGLRDGGSDGAFDGGLFDATRPADTGPQRPPADSCACSAPGVSRSGLAHAAVTMALGAIGALMGRRRSPPTARRPSRR